MMQPRIRWRVSASLPEWPARPGAPAVSPALGVFLTVCGLAMGRVLKVLLGERRIVVAP